MTETMSHKLEQNVITSYCSHGATLNVCCSLPQKRGGCNTNSDCLHMCQVVFYPINGEDSTSQFPYPWTP